MSAAFATRLVAQADLPAAPSPANGLAWETKMKPVSDFDRAAEIGHVSEVLPLHHSEKSGRALVLCSATRLEQVLGQILEEFLCSNPSAEKLLKGSTAPISQLSSRLLLCHALALIDEHEFADGNLISAVCDQIHGSSAASLASAPVISLCNKLHFRDRRCAPNSAQDNFASAVARLLGRLKDRPFYVGGEKRSRRMWHQ
jgi:hypothetical protein